MLRPRIKLLQKQPPQSTRLEFVNAILNGFDGWKFMADLRCRKFTEDMIYQQKNSDGTKSKSIKPQNGWKRRKIRALIGHLGLCIGIVSLRLMETVPKSKDNN